MRQKSPAYVQFAIKTLSVHLFCHSMNQLRKNKQRRNLTDEIKGKCLHLLKHCLILGETADSLIIALSHANKYS